MLSKQQYRAGMVFMAVGAYVVYYALAKLKVGSIHAPGSGFFTFICGAGIFLFSAILVVGGLRSGTEDWPLWEKGQWKKPMLAFGITVIYTLLMGRLGFIIATILFLAAWQFILEREKPVRAAAVIIIGTAAMWVLFEKFLRVPLPNGLLPW